MQISKYIIELLTIITLLFLSSCTYNYVFFTEDICNYSIFEKGFCNKTYDILKEYGASTAYDQREISVIEYDENGVELSIGNLVKIGDSNGLSIYGVSGRYDSESKQMKSAPNASYIKIRVAMNAGKMGYIYTDPIELKPEGVNEIMLDVNTPLHIDLNVSEKEVEKGYIIKEKGFYRMIYDLLIEYGASTNYDQRGLSVIEYDENGVELSIGNLVKIGDSNGLSIYEVSGRYDSESEQNMSSPNASYIKVRAAMNAGKMGYIYTDPIPLQAFKLNEIVLNESTPVHVKLHVYEDEVEKRYIIKEKGFYRMIYDLLIEYGASTNYDQRGLSVIEYDANGVELRIGSLMYMGGSNGVSIYGVTGSYDLSTEQNMSSPNASYIKVRAAMNAGKMGYIYTDPIPLQAFKLNEIVLNESTPVHVDLNSE